MRNRFDGRSAILAAMLLFCWLNSSGFHSPLFAQTAKPPAAAKPQPKMAKASPQRASAKANLSGVWAESQPPSTADQYWVFAFSPQELPMTSWGEEQYKASKPSFGPRSVAIADTNDPVYHGCFPPGVPRVYLHPFPMQIAQLPDQVIILYEYDNLSRHIYTDGRKHNMDLPPTWMGDSIGKWEGDTLVADTTNFNDKTWLDRIGHPHSADLHVIERFRRVGNDKLQIELTIEDPKAYTKPWTAHLYYSLQKDWSLLEQFCEDNDTFQEVEKEETNKPAK
jgi:hypothetical protein